MGNSKMQTLAVVLVFGGVLAASATWTSTLGDLATTTMLSSTGYTQNNCNCVGCANTVHKLNPATSATLCEAACDEDAGCHGSLFDSVGIGAVKCFLYTQDITLHSGNSNTHSRFTCYKKSGTVAQISTSGMTVSQSTTTHSAPGSRAVDGNTNQNFGSGSCTHTGSSNDWWKIELGTTKWISKVKVWNRSDCCNTRLTNSYVQVSGTNCTGALGSSTSVQEITCEEAGSEVKIVSGNSGSLQICEVQIWGY